MKISCALYWHNLASSQTSSWLQATKVSPSSLPPWNHCHIVTFCIGNGQSYSHINLGAGSVPNTQVDIGVRVFHKRWKRFAKVVGRHEAWKNVWLVQEEHPENPSQGDEAIGMVTAYREEDCEVLDAT